MNRIKIPENNLKARDRVEGNETLPGYYKGMLVKIRYVLCLVERRLRT